jgi:hypothetical protein
VQTFVYVITVKPLSAIAVLADSQLATTLTLVVNHLDVSYTVG